MGFMSAEERALAAALSRLGYANPFLPERIEAEGAALGPAFVHADRVWSVRTDRTVQNPNVARLAERATTLAALLRERLAAGAEPAESDRVLYEDVVLYLLYTRFEDDLLDLVVKAADAGDTGRRVHFYEKCRAGQIEEVLAVGAELPRSVRRGAARPPRARPSVRLPLPGPPRLPSHLLAHHRRLDVDGAPACRRLAIDLHARHEALPAGALRAHGRRHHAHRRPVGHGQGGG